VVVALVLVKEVLVAVANRMVVKEVLAVVARVAETVVVVRQKMTFAIKACVNQWDITMQWRRNDVEQ
jgi:hypothetical protein